MMHSDELLVSIITVVYNGEKTIARTIESVLNQTYGNIEYIVVDGVSSDKTLDVIKRYKDRFHDGKRITIISESDDGMYEALNKGIRLAHGFLIGNINADDWYEPAAVEEMVRLYKYDEYDIAWADLRLYKDNRFFVKKAKVGRLLTTAHFCHPSMFAKKEVLLKYPYLEKNMDDDFDMVLRANKGGAKILTLNKVIANYSLGGMSTQKSLSNMCKRIKMKYITYVRNGYSCFYLLYCVAVEGAKFLVG
ncbi:glycosyltransferase family 2 protein [Butyrivibrio sp. VCD2006]|uniref:glycosyltransferase family 2 protein n=1 Tax=Butyrivibrio sp. VCD2006 TaxID=1280664 RepID=UPI000421569C|nr:glycosyltransferase family 2 protein [Butyrivibrio sp. VCD2006]